VYARRPRPLGSVVIFLVATVFLCARIGANSSTKSKISRSTEERIDARGWWPTKSSAARTDFVGTAECAKCHERIAATQLTTPMAQASTSAVNSEILRTHSDLSAQRTAYHYELFANPAAVNFSVSDGANSLSATVGWAFGLGHKGQTYIYEREGEFYESRLSFYKTLQGLDVTTGDINDQPDDLKSAMGRWLGAGEAQRCFGCHATGASVAGHLDTAHLTPGVQCESCHGPGAQHVTAMKSGKIEQGRRAIFNPSQLDAVDSVDFCGACHRSWADVILSSAPGVQNVMNVRFQPYRLEDSKCWLKTKGDARLTCTACHNPHEQLVQDLSAYDKKCLTCHTSSAATSATLPHATASNHPGQSCPVSTKNCVTCHMPQIEVPSVHATFFDHRIRVVRPNAPYPM
jgi:Cytochrome c554 and c-prime